MEGLTERIVKAIVFTDTKTIARGLLSPSPTPRLSRSLFGQLDRWVSLGVYAKEGVVGCQNVNRRWFWR